jgi:enoyl-CoA hydratase
MAPILFETNSSVAEMVLNRPQARNALSPEMLCRMADAVLQFSQDPSLRVLLLRAEGPVFCAGGDLALSIPLLTGARPAQDAWDERVLHDPLVMAASSLRGFELDKPVVCAIEGPCYAAGFEIMLGTDLRIASERASFCLPEVQRGVLPFAGSMARLPRQVPWTLAMQLLLTGEPMDAPQALRAGLVNEVTLAGQATQRARALAQRIADNAPIAVQQVKRTALLASGLPLAQGFALEDAARDTVLATDDAREGPRAFMEKRAPVYKGR